MKKKSLRSASIVLLILTSMACYVFLNTVKVAKPKVDCSLSKELEHIDVESQDMILPDVQIVKTLLEKGKEFLPAS